MFKDNCCKREILALQIHCRNESRGCAEQLTLGHLLVSLAGPREVPARCGAAGGSRRGAAPRGQVAASLGKQSQWEGRQGHLGRRRYFYDIVSRTAK